MLRYRWKSGLVIISLAAMMLFAACSQRTVTQPAFKTPTFTSTASLTPTPTEKISTQPASATPAPTIVVVKASTPTPQSSGEGESLYTITIINPFNYDAHIFLDNLYLITVRGGQEATHPGVSAGKHNIHYCKTVELLACSQPENITVSEDTTWEMSELPVETAVPTNQTAQPAPTYTPYAISSSSYQIKITNLYPWKIFVFLDGEEYLTVPKKKYRTYTHVPGGEHVFQFCTKNDVRTCFTSRTLDINGNVELIISP